MVLVVLGHFYQSMTISGIVEKSGFCEFFHTIIYLFHVHLFFMCCEWLYQKYSKVTAFSEWKNNVIRKFILHSLYIRLNISNQIEAKQNNPIKLKRKTVK